MYYTIYIRYFSGEFSIINPVDFHSVYANFRGDSTDIDEQGYNEQIVYDQNGVASKVVYGVT